MGPRKLGNAAGGRSISSFHRIGGSVSIEVTPEAAEVLRRSLDMSQVDPASGGIRLRGSVALGGGFDVQVELAEAPAEGEDVVEDRGVRLFVGSDITNAFPRAIVALEPQHEVVVVRAAPGSEPGSGPEDAA
jgi:Fe-S cluster assembly iron-binding protein IscA